VFSDFLVFIKQGNEKVLVNYDVENQDYIEKVLNKSIQKFSDRKFSFLPKLVKKNFNEYLILKQMEYLSRYPLYAKGLHVEIYMLDPSLWYFMKEKQINEVEFVICSFYHKRKKDKTVDGYKSSVHTNYENLFKTSKNNRFLTTIITELQLIDKAFLKISNINFEEKLNNNRSCEKEIVTRISQSLESKDEKAKLAGKQYQGINR